ncbi:MAG: tRNA-intron lyase [Candidatus Aenigmarchaeota archaeon CG_4_10_14_0_8_um_filter_37_24]|nr:tRNA-intron lyase [Candidatus Aenigmarchaeota archaeon]PIV68155.1 MAG: tRNA-intron lyase [Candidatus Aenigmarchaeota archaeon CG01_land_8_20_14_3_00_37_9]PIW40799.1 MAG: tRNA-intron lyase [Candidatus Aenigmarchaeota archaeon CG15_BIG_FIL_POST_REV_8_21_14_020_37_27]PIX50282.1 MAG: tRNA-intron lyase [Candidatus Aenigmarchaeota archaeon CG_4_8_14_3_um_filter_37_24]PIY35182.1 MAG: tRNA-intron lyase [Candidatus Aenigmarchaeota archaeon CG_4_10_14_3_um_filter_37_21]PIZ33767.1 MAG: tRNA-intron lya
MIKGELVEQRVFILEKSEDVEKLVEAGYGKELEDKLELALVEAMYLVNKDKLEVKKDDKKMSKQGLMKYSEETERNFHAKLIVYSDLRERGFVVKTGFKFGCDFRVYERGVKVKKGPKESHEHTKWVVHAIPEEFNCSFPELSRAVRLAQNIRTEMIWAVIDSENDATYYSIKRITP